MGNTRRGTQKRKHSQANQKAASKQGRGRPKRSEDAPFVCIVPECERPAYARGLCQTHHRQMITTGKLNPIRPYRKRSTGTVKFAGFRLTPHCAQTVDAYAEERGLSRGAAIAQILESSLVSGSKKAGEP